MVGKNIALPSHKVATLYTCGNERLKNKTTCMDATFITLSISCLKKLAIHKA